MSQPLIGQATCGNCKFGATIKEDLTMRECRGLPPTPSVLGMTQQGPQILLTRPRLASKEPGCALHKAMAPALAS